MRPSRSMYADGWASSEMPLRQYFLFVGGGLLALLFVAGVLPQPEERTGSGPNLPVIRIHSELKGPPAVAIDTSQRMITPATTAQADVDSESAPFDLPESRIGESLAQSVAPLRRQVSAGEPKKRSEHNSQPKRKRFRARTKYPSLQVTQRTKFGWFDTSW